MRRMDMFLTPLPNFNLNGRQALRTPVGGAVTSVIFYTIIMYAALKLTHLLDRHNPNINSYTNRNAFEYSDEFEMGSQGFRMAFGVERHKTREVLDDPRYVKWYAAAIDWDDAKGRQVKEIPMHPCTKEDYD